MSYLPRIGQDFDEFLFSPLISVQFVGLILFKFRTW